MSLPSWTVKRRADSREHTYSDGQLRQLIRKVSFSGLELVKPPLAHEWVPLHTLPLFREEATGGRETPDAAALARNRASAMRRFITMMTAAGALGLASAGFAMAGSNAATAAVGAMSLVMVGAGWVSGMALAIKYGGRSGGRKVRATVAPVHDELESAMVALESALASAPASVRDAVHLPTVKQGVDATRRKRVLLQSLQSPQDPRPELLTELATARECLAKATDPGTTDAFADEIRSIEGLLDSLDRGLKAASEAEARERALVNELEALRHSVVHASIAGTSQDELVDRLASLRIRLEEESAIERDLAQGASGGVRSMGPLKS